jgi:hypothetical protein
MVIKINSRVHNVTSVHTSSPQQPVTNRWHCVLFSKTNRFEQRTYSPFGYFIPLAVWPQSNSSDVLDVPALSDTTWPPPSLFMLLCTQSISLPLKACISLSTFRTFEIYVCLSSSVISLESTLWINRHKQSSFAWDMVALLANIKTLMNTWIYFAQN